LKYGGQNSKIFTMNNVSLTISIFLLFGRNNHSFIWINRTIRTFENNLYDCHYQKFIDSIILQCFKVTFSAVIPACSLIIWGFLDGFTIALGAILTYPAIFLTS
jgi:hypothetical protein